MGFAQPDTGRESEPLRGSLLLLAPSRPPPATRWATGPHSSTRSPSLSDRTVGLGPQMAETALFALCLSVSGSHPRLTARILGFHDDVLPSDCLATSSTWLPVSRSGRYG